MGTSLLEFFFPPGALGKHLMPWASILVGPVDFRLAGEREHRWIFRQYCIIQPGFLQGIFSFYFLFSILPISLRRGGEYFLLSQVPLSEKCRSLYFDSIPF